MEAKHIILVAQGLCGITACIQLLGWCVYYRGGIAFISSNKDRISNVHAVFTFVGLIFIPSEAILAYKLLPLRHRVRKSVHLTALLIAMVLGAIGINAAFTFQRQSGILEILYSLHSWLGAGTIFLFIFQVQCCSGWWDYFVSCTLVCQRVAGLVFFHGTEILGCSSI
ncbi:probable ascorbate-specific transmembrane electron transporter 2 isoform X2 [Cryptomeria japonica]|uniref:probable ascorbate-specific transmembrane electron transporter 2 isoform X2 n=1 Tax=Cryptomeria japonica TaxID=3369 RepID=UPI0027DAA33A|nr:probable ascorbate-specific transmembrane electron transporter 2 isoform X2 [Cryptomeria japonica]